MARVREVGHCRNRFTGSSRMDRESARHKKAFFTPTHGETIAGVAFSMGSALGATIEVDHDRRGT
jgi:hypothetical protein